MQTSAGYDFHLISFFSGVTTAYQERDFDKQVTHITQRMLREEFSSVQKKISP